MDVTADDRGAVQTLVHAGETAEAPSNAAPRAAGISNLLLALLPAIAPDGGEPIEADACEGVVQNLACARVF
ncbi:hypothetical protein HNR23_002032 [Nocardiopsis mwathae]|uniref:Uncharacterized protein n=1 Tax=Nocardiopsis mwathae TaxID=1472723 RepID=A0A7W9YH18_9ACTN|nr:hypothetical protein [Nocardiopsis mwathae]MBB6171972.1 hypothetical protein [Nocardiopsis mwathae]